MAIIRSKRSGSVFRNGAVSVYPALLTRMSTGPSRFAASVHAVCTTSRLVRSATTTALGPVRDAVTVSARVASRTISVTLAPSLDSARTLAAPIPRLAPVTDACRPERALTSVLPAVDRPAQPLRLPLHVHVQ